MWKYGSVPNDLRGIIFAGLHKLVEGELCCHIIPNPVYATTQPTCVFVEILITFYNSGGSYISPQRISKTIGEITGVTSAAVIHSISPSPQQDMLLPHP